MNDAALSEADSYLIKNDFKQAEEGYRALLDSDDTGDAYAGLAVALAKQAKPSQIIEAEKILRQARDKFPDNPNVIAAGGYVSYVHQKTVASPAKRDLYLEAAETLCKRAIKANPDILIAHQTLGLVKMAQDDYDEAVPPLREAARIADNFSNLTVLGQALLKVDPKNKESEEMIRTALQMKPDYAPAHLQKAILLEIQNKPEDAYMELHNIPENLRQADWYSVKGDISRRQGDGPGALQAWREATRLDPHNPEPYKHTADYYSQRGDGELAIGQMHDALEILPNDMVLRSKLAELALRQDKLEVAETEYKTILAANADDANALLGLSRVGYRKARRDGQYPPDWQKTQERLNNIVTEQSVKGTVMKGGSSAKQLKENIELNEAERELSQQHFRDARKKFLAVITEHKDNPYELLNLGEQVMNDGDLKSAEQAYQYAKEIPEVAPRAEQGISRITAQRSEAARQTKLGDATLKLPEVALDHYNQALIADPQCPDAFYGKLAVEQATEPDKAIADALCFLEAADDNNPMRREVESTLIKLKKHVAKPGKK